MSAPNRWIAPAEGAHPASDLGLRDSLANVERKQVVLLSALLDGDPDLLINAISSGASESYVYPDGWAPLHFAVEHCWPTLAAILLAVGADPNQPNGSGWTSLHLAVDIAVDGANQCDYDVPDDSMVRLLLVSGADPSVVDHQGETPVDVAKNYRWTHGIELLTHFGKPSLDE